MINGYKNIVIFRSVKSLINYPVIMFQLNSIKLFFNNLPTILKINKINCNYVSRRFVYLVSQSLVPIVQETTSLSTSLRSDNRMSLFIIYSKVR